MRELGYDRVETDPLGNVAEVVEGTGGGRNIPLNGHMDHVPPEPMRNLYSSEVLAS